MGSPQFVFAYFGPETMLPVTSIVATVIGMSMMFGRSIVRLLVHGIRRLSRRTSPGDVVKGPHTRSRPRHVPSESIAEEPAER